MDTSIIYIVGIVIVAYFLLIKPQQKEKKAFQKMLDGMKKGDKVITTSGIYAEISALKDGDMVTLKVADGVKIDFSKSSIAKILNKKD